MCYSNLPFRGSELKNEHKYRGFFFSAIPTDRASRHKSSSAWIGCEKKLLTPVSYVDVHESDVSADFRRHPVLRERAVRADDGRGRRVPRRSILCNCARTKKKTYFKTIRATLSIHRAICETEGKSVYGSP